MSQPLLLASASPRRRDLLEQIHLAFEVVSAEVDETPRPGESAKALVGRLAQTKIQSAASHLKPKQWGLAADTVVVVADRILGKPVDATQAHAMLRHLAGRSHEVITGMALLRRDESPRVCTVHTRVWLRDLSDADISAYWATGEPAGKAGSYAIQGRGAAFVERIEGSYSNVVGLPLFELEHWLAAIPDPPPRTHPNP